MARSAAAASQRQRVLGGMIAAAARYGLGDTKVAQVIREAGVSRATFYEHFADRDECFLVAHGQIAEAIEESVRQNLECSPGELLGDLLRSADRDPAAARAALVEGLAGDAAVRARHEELLSWLEERLESYLDNPPADTPPLEIPGRAVLGGVAGLVAVRIFRGEAGRLEEQCEDLLAWVESYALPAGEKRRTPAAWRAMGADWRSEAEESLGPAVLARSLPRGRGALAPALVAGEQRKRILAAVAELAREKGYSQTTVADLVATAGVTREAFYDLFRDKEEAFLATQAFGLEASVAFTAGRFFSEASWPDRVWDGLEATLSYIASQRSLMYVDLIESYAAGSAAIRRSFDNRMAYTLFLEEGYRQRPEAAELPRLVSEGISGAIQELFRHQVSVGRGQHMLELLPLAAYLTLAPFTGVAAALDLVESRLRERKPGPDAPRAQG